MNFSRPSAGVFTACNCKRAHTRLLNTVAEILNRAAPRQALDNNVAALLSAYDRVIAIHNRNVKITDLDDQEPHATDVLI
jgi:hypothetical protein